MFGKKEKLNLMKETEVLKKKVALLEVQNAQIMQFTNALAQDLHDLKVANANQNQTKYFG